MASSLVSKVNVTSKSFLGQSLSTSSSAASVRPRTFKVVARGTQQKATGTIKKAIGTAKQAVGNARQAVGTSKQAAGSAKKLFGQAEKAAGTVKKSGFFGQAQKAAGTVKKSTPGLFGQAKKAVGTVRRSAPAPSTVKKVAQQNVVNPVKRAAPAAARTVKRTARKAAGNASDEELSKWYGPNRRLFLPEGLLDRAEVPAYLNGEIAGDYGYDPLGLGRKEKDFDQYRAAELIHARWAMLGAAGIVIPEALNRSGLPCGPEAVWWKTGAQLLEGDALQWCGITVPLNLVAATIAEIVLVGGAEYYRSANKSPLGSDLDPLHPGGYFDPLGLADDPDQFALLKVKEIKNGRLALFAALGFFVQAYVTRDGPVANLAAHLDDPFANNIITVIGGNIERSPVL